MKRKNNLYSTVLDIKKIQIIYQTRVKKNTKNKKKLEIFEYAYISHMIEIKKILENKNYIPSNYHIFLIKEPKLRLIMSQDIIDKVVNHIVSEYFLIQVFEPTFIQENIATRKNKGTSYGIRLLKQYLNEVKRKDFYILKFDIKKYFFYIDHEIIKKLIRKKIKDNDVLNILDQIIDSSDEYYVNEKIKKIKEFEIRKIKAKKIKDEGKRISEISDLPEYRKGKGLPIGNMSSQILAILYLNELDHFIKEKLNIQYYIRYMDGATV